jgi:hypothetical protein
MPEDAEVCNFWGDPHITHLFFSEKMYSAVLLPGSVVSLSPSTSEKYCTDDGDQGVNCNATAVGDQEKFTVVDAGGGKIGLRGGQSGRFCADELHRSRTICNRDRMGGWEKFTVFDREDGTVGLRGGRNSKFCAVDLNGKFVCGRDHLLDKEEFTVTIHKEGRPVIPPLTEFPLAGAVVAVQGGRGGKYCTDDGVHGVRCNADTIGDWEKFTVEDAGDGKVALRGGQTGKYCADEFHNNRTICNRGGIGGWEKFRVADRADNKIALRGGKANSFCSDEGRGVICNRRDVGANEEFTLTILQEGVALKLPVLGKGGRSKRHPTLINFQPQGTFKLAESEDKSFEAQAFFCPAFGRTTTTAAVAMRFGNDVIQLIRGEVTAPSHNNRSRLQYYADLSSGQEKDFIDFHVNGKKLAWSELGTADGTRGRDVPNVGGGANVGKTAYLQQMHTALESNIAMLPVCAGTTCGSVSVEVNTPWFDDSQRQRVFESAVTIRMQNPAEAGICGDLPDGLRTDGEKHRVPAEELLFTSKQMKSLCEMCRLESNGDACGAPGHEVSAEEVCNAVGASYTEARQACLADFAEGDDWLEACAMETCALGPAATTLAKLELQREDEGVSPQR